MSAPPRATGWTELVASAVAHDINNLVHTLSNERALIAAPAGANGGGGSGGSVGSPDLVEECLCEFRKLGARLHTLARARGAGGHTLIDDACVDALVEVDPTGARVLRGQPPSPGTCVRGSAAAVRTAIVSLLEHALAASPTSAQIRMTVRQAPGETTVVEIAAREVSGLGAVDDDRLDALLATTLRDLRGDVSLILAGAIADAIGGAVHVESSPGQGLVLGLRLAPANRAAD
jgi:signal transduction histidine kinase